MRDVYLLIEENYCSCIQDVELLACDHINTSIRGAFETIEAAARCLSNLGSREVDRWECVPPDDLRSCDHEVAAWESVRCAGGPELGVRVSVRLLSVNQPIINVLDEFESP